MQEIDRFDNKDRILLGVTLFSMFFGAGNLIFPPFLGAQAGSHTWLAFVGFAASAVFLPVLGVVAVTKSGGLENLASRVHTKFSSIYILVLYLAIGPCLAIPRTAGTSFSIAVVPFWNGGGLWAVRLLYSIVFFAAATIVAMHPEKLTEYLGKRLTPILLTLIIVIFAASLLHPTGNVAAPHMIYKKMPAIQGLLDGYQTMDTLAALNFGMIVAMNIRAKGMKEEKQVMQETVRAGWTAGIFLIAIYAMLAFIGMASSERFAGTANGTETLTKMVTFSFGKAGAVILAVIFVIACFNTCVGLFSCCGKYFEEICPRIPYRNWVFLFAFVSMIISNIGLDAILKFSVPVLNAIYPIAILLIFLSCIHHWIEKYPAVYQWSAAACGISSVILVLNENGIRIPGITKLLKYIPGCRTQFGWVVPTGVGIVIGIVVSKIKRKSI